MAKPQEISEQELRLRLEHLREEYKLARQGLFGGLITSGMAIVALTITAGIKIGFMGSSYVWLVLIAASAIVIYFAFVFGRIASIRTKITKTQLSLNIVAGQNARFPSAK